MNIDSLFKNKALKPKEKTETLCRMIQDLSLTVNEVIEFAKKSKDPVKASCIEALELLSRINASLVSAEAFDFVVTSLTEKAPRIKWESARVIGNTASLYSETLEAAIHNLQVNTEHEGTVVRWSVAYALGEIIRLNTANNYDLLATVEAICEREEKNSIRKIYQTALKKQKTI